MRHRRRSGRLGLETEHRLALLRNLARGLIVNQRIVTTHAKAKEASRFVDKLVTIAKQNTLHARRHLISKLGSGSESLASRMLETVAPRFSERKGGYTRVLRYRNRAGDGASLALLEFTTQIETLKPKPKQKKTTQKPADSTKAPTKKAEPSDKDKKVKADDTKKEGEMRKEEQKKGGFLSKLRRFLKGDEGK